ASELKALFNYPDLDKDLDLIAIDGYLSSLALPEPHSVFRKVHKLPAGHFLKVRRGKVQLQCYWEARFSNRLLASHGRAKADGLVEEFRHRLEDTVKLSLRSDVPVGVLLSGGVDSSSVTAIASRERAYPLHTFSVAFKEDEFNEAEFSRMVAKRFATKHHEVLVTKRRATQIASRLVELLDEPFADSSSIPTYAVCEEASKYVKTVLSGEGADELLGGYPWHAAKLARGHKYKNSLAIKEHPSRVIFTEAQREGLYSKEWRRELQKLGKRRRHLDESQNASQLSVLNRSLLEDIQTYLPSDILVKSDRMSMLHSLEIRVPFLNRVFAEFAMSLPDKMKVNGEIRKHILKESMKGILPNRILERLKKGFSIPMDLWLWEKGQWREMIYDTIFSQRTRERGQFDMTVLERLQREHERLENLHGYKLWTIFVFESWQRAWLD
ncbi:MAG TPA: asparagine synthase (glutamine-hydrolyzing), partial [Blastocatellia bacterium]|nr:asparagine synthase (glutamine-hydrolyzing) [Blastocatellia bacterium]